MSSPKECCGVKPDIWKCLCDLTEICVCDVEKIECMDCGRAIYGYDEESISRWNEGWDNDE